MNSHPLYSHWVADELILSWYPSIITCKMLQGVYFLAPSRLLPSGGNRNGRWRVQDDGLRVLIGDRPTRRTAQAGCQGRTCGNKHRCDFPLLEGLLPVVFELVSVRELIEQLRAVKISPAVDEDSSGRVELP